MRKLVERYMTDTSGATAIEYALIASLIAVFIITAVGGVGTRISGVFNQISSSLSPAGG